MLSIIVRSLAAAAAVWRAPRRPGPAVAEIDRQQRRFRITSLPADARPARPETYTEFLVRTRGSLLPDPSARARLTGRVVR